MIQKFLTEKRDLTEASDEGLPFITISRQAGAGGHLLSYIILTELLKCRGADVFQGWHVFDKALCEAVAGNPTIQADMESLVAEEYRSEFRDFIESLFTGQSKQYVINKMTFKVVRILALIGKVIIVGRGGSLVTADMPQGIHIRLVAPEAQRIVWMMKRFKLRKEQARETVAKQDADRRKLIKLFFHRDIADPLLYDVVWNTGRTDLDMIARNAIDLIRQRALAGARSRTGVR